MRSLGLALFTCLMLAACSTQRQTVGTAGRRGGWRGCGRAGRGGGRRGGGRSRDRSGLLLLSEPLGPAAAGSVLIAAILTLLSGPFTAHSLRRLSHFSTDLASHVLPNPDLQEAERRRISASSAP